jgi:hypothetical protein
MGDMMLAVALGCIPGYTSFRKFGMNPDVDTGTEEVWPLGTLRVLPTSAGALSIVSDSIADVMTTGTGAWELVVEGLDSNYDPISETVEMDGTTPVASVSSDWFRVNRMYNITAGTGGVNAGNITCSIGGDTQAYVEANQGQTHQTHYTVPRAHTLVITGFHYSVGRMGNTDLQVWSQVKFFNGGTGNEAWRTLDDTFMFENNFDNDHDVFLIPEKCEIRQRVVATTTNAEIACTYSGYLVEDKYI